MSNSNPYSKFIGSLSLEQQDLFRQALNSKPPKSTEVSLTRVHQSNSRPHYGYSPISPHQPQPAPSTYRSQPQPAQSRNRPASPALLTSTNKEINCENYRTDDLNFYNLLYPLDEQSEEKKYKLSFLLRFYLFKGRCYGVMSSNPLRKMVIEDNMINIYGGDFKKKIFFEAKKKEFVSIPIDIFKILVDITPFVSFTIFQKIEEELINLQDKTYEQKRDILINIVATNIPHISSLFTIGTSFKMAWNAALVAVTLAAAFFSAGLLAVPVGTLAMGISFKKFREDKRNHKLNESATNSSFNPDTNTISLCTLLLTNLMNYIAYQKYFNDFKISDEEKNKFINTYFPTNLLEYVGTNMKIENFRSKVTEILNDIDPTKSKKSIEDLKQISEEIKRIAENMQQQGGKKQKKKRLVDCTVKELKEKMKKKGKKLSKDGVPLTKSQMLKALKK